MFDGEILKKLRINRDMNQTDLADILGVSQRNISSYETNRSRPDFDTLEKIADYFNVSLDYLFNRTTMLTDNLNDQEQYIIKTYRALREENKIQFMTMTNMIKTLRDIQKKNLG